MPAVQETFDEWNVRNHEGAVSAATALRHERNFRNHILPHIGHRDLESLTKADMLTLFNITLPEKTNSSGGPLLGGSSQRGIYQTMTGFLAFAVSQGYLPATPLESVPAPFKAHLRLQAFGVGLPKTGSTSLAQAFSHYSTRHEWDMLPLLRLGHALESGRINEARFWDISGGRFNPPFLEMDVCTAHHVYVDVLARRYPRARFVHLVRDVGSWANSMLDMGWRMRRARAQVSMSTADWDQASDFYAGISVTADPSDTRPDTDALPGLMAAWAEHMRKMANVLPPDRTIRVKTSELTQRLPEVAAFLGADPREIDVTQEPSRVSPLRCDRFRLAPKEMAAIYSEHCAELMVSEFSDEHERVLGSLRQEPVEHEWTAYVEATDQWVERAIARYGPVMTV